MKKSIQEICMSQKKYYEANKRRRDNNNYTTIKQVIVDLATKKFDGINVNQ